MNILRHEIVAEILRRTTIAGAHYPFLLRRVNNFLAMFVVGLILYSLSIACTVSMAFSRFLSPNKLFYKIFMSSRLVDAGAGLTSIHFNCSSFACMTFSIRGSPCTKPSSWSFSRKSISATIILFFNWTKPIVMCFA